ncbi:MAG: hypothetical protein IJ597_05135 [Synergistaceae bacterium]|nr:hypothetical protein [Synergistaceae bacterium]
MNGAAAEIEYVPREVFNVHLQSIAEKNELERKIDALDAKFTRKFDALDSKIDSTKIELQGQINVLSEKIDSVKTDFTTKFNNLNERVGSLENNVNARLNDMSNANNKWLAFIAVLVTVVAPIITIVAQKFFLN